MLSNITSKTILSQSGGNTDSAPIAFGTFNLDTLFIFNSNIATGGVLYCFAFYIRSFYRIWIGVNNLYKISRSNLGATGYNSYICTKSINNIK